VKKYEGTSLIFLADILVDDLDDIHKVMEKIRGVHAPFRRRRY
jgi:hypothetical protein